ncbi:alpha/beta hydrolase [Algoriphagus namhaensis]
MSFYKAISICLLILFIIPQTFAQKDSRQTYVIVHGAWGGGWAFREVDSLLTQKGAQVYRPTLTGQGERVHLASEKVGLYTHILDIVNTILFEDLHEIVLVGHSYGGMVITGVADQIPDRIQKIIYLDAMLPENGESVFSMSGGDESRYQIENGGIIPAWVKGGQAPPKDVPHPLKTWKDPILLQNPKRLEIDSYYILTVEAEKKPEEDGFARHAARAKEKGWKVYQLEADHNAQWSTPVELTEMLFEIGGE